MGEVFHGPKKQDIVDGQRAVNDAIKQTKIDEWASESLDQILDEIENEFNDEIFGESSNQSSVAEKIADLPEEQAEKVKKELFKRINEKIKSVLDTVKAKNIESGNKRKNIVINNYILKTLGIIAASIILGGVIRDVIIKLKNPDPSHKTTSGSSAIIETPEEPDGGLGIGQTGDLYGYHGAGAHQYSNQDQDNDEIAYVIDISDYFNKSQRAHVFELLEREMIAGICVEVARTEQEYPLSVRTFDDERIKSDLTKYEAAGKAQFTHNLGKLDDITSIMCESPVTIPYAYTCAISDEEAEVEAACIVSGIKRIKESMPEGYDFQKKVGPISIDIENCGKDRMPDWSMDAATEAKRIEAVEQRTDAVLHLIESLKKEGVVDERGIIIYGGLERMNEGSEINWQRLFSEIKNMGVNYYIWGSKMLNESLENGRIKVCEDVDDFGETFFNSGKNIERMKNQYKQVRGFANDVCMLQIYLNQTIKTTSDYTERFDVNITTKKLLDAMVNGKHYNYGIGFMTRLISLDPSFEYRDMLIMPKEVVTRINSDGTTPTVDEYTTLSKPDDVDDIDM